MTGAVLRGGLTALLAFLVLTAVALALAGALGADAALDRSGGFTVGAWVLLGLAALGAAAAGTWQAALGGAPTAGAAMQVGGGTVLLLAVADLVLGLGDPGLALGRFVLVGLGAVAGAFLLGRRLEAA